MNTFRIVILAGALSAGQAWAADHAGLPAIPDETLNQNQLLTVLELMNSGEIEQSSVALQRALHRNVKGLAQQLVNDHLTLNEYIEELKQADFELESSELSEQIAAQAEDRLMAVAELDASQYDCVFINDQIGQHQRAMQLVSPQLTSPVALAEPLRVFLNQTFTELESHGEALQALLDQDLCPDLQDATP